MTKPTLPILVAAALAAAPAFSQDVVKYVHLDAIGNVRAITNQAKEVIERHDYLPFGEECLTPPCTPLQGTNARKFTGKERDVETGLDYFGARYYGSKIGRFTTVDPVYTWNDNLVDPQRWNRYAYGNNNPFRYVDPDGRSPKLVTTAIKLAIKGGDVYSTVSGIADAGSTLFSADVTVGTGDRLLAAGSLVLEVSGASDIYSAGKGVRSAINHGALKRGRESEARVLDALGETKNKAKVTGCEGCSIPDYQNATTIGEIKDAARVDDTRQIRIQRQAAAKSGREHVIQTGPNTGVSRNVERGGTRVERRPDLGPK